ncbi:MAG TPA: peptidoglycan-binding protein [Solirubrobacteraceae bacterium]|nr:peptidoglycan-binding protein [Solirubrobacteraceae bacterium]
MPHLRHIAITTLLFAVALPGAAAIAQTPAVQSSTPAAPSASPETRLPRVSARVLRPGSKGAQVRGMQQLLRAAGVTTDVDGTYAYKTSRAVQRFQVAARLEASGVAGPETLRALRRAARGPRAGEASGGVSFGDGAARVAKLGQRIPLAVGMSGRDVKELQDFLRRAGVKGAPRPTGEFTRATGAAVRRFESGKSRSTDGEVDAGDIYALLTEVGGDAMPGDAGDPSRDLPAPPLAPGDKARLTADGLAVAPEDAPEAVKQIIAAGNRIAKLPYKWGGGHGRWEDSGYDCSGSVSYALRGAGLLKSPLASYDYFGWGQSGKGQWVTVYTNSGHMYMTVAGLRFDTSGRGPRGSRWQKDMRDPGAFTIRHPAGL